MAEHAHHGAPGRRSHCESLGEDRHFQLSGDRCEKHRRHTGECLEVPRIYLKRWHIKLVFKYGAFILEAACN